MSCKAIFQLETIKYDFVCKFRRARAAFHYFRVKTASKLHVCVCACMTCMRQAKKVADDAEKAPVDHSCSH